MTEPVVTTSMFTEAEQAAWDVAVERGLPIEAADLRALLNGATPHILADFSKRTAGMAEALNNAAAIIEDRDRQLAAARAEERARLANRAEMIDEVRHELDDAFQFANADGSRHGYVTREWVQALLATHAASAGAAECERTIRLAEEVDARFVAPLPDGGWRHFADLLREDGNEPA